MAEQLVYHWKHGWLPLTHAAALSKAKGNNKLADKYVRGTSAHHASVATQGKSAAQIHRGIGRHARIMAHPGSYRGEAGHHITGTDTRGRKVAVFVPGDRAAAQKAIDNLHAGKGPFDNPQRQQVGITQANHRAFGNNVEGRPQAQSGGYREGQRIEHQVMNFSKPGFPTEWKPGTVEKVTKRPDGLTELTVRHDDGTATVEMVGKRGGNRKLRTLTTEPGHVADHRAVTAQQKAFDRIQRSRALKPGVAADLRGGSAEKHLVHDAAGTHFTAERAALHQHIIDTILGDHKRQDHPVYTMLGGGPASGKTKAKDQALSDHPDAVVIDPDAIKKMLPEYAQLPRSEAAQHVHEESSYLAKLVTQSALNRKTHVIVDAVGDNSVKSVTDKIAQAKAAGYTTHGSYVTVPTAIAQERARLRGEKSGRVVPPHVIESLHVGVSDVFPQVMHQFDSAALYDNTAEWKKVLSAHKGQPAVVHELELYRKFLRKKAA